MKKLILILSVYFALQQAKAQQIILAPGPLYDITHVYTNICYIKYEYDNAGNRISRNFECGTNPFFVSLISGGGTGGGNNLRPNGDLQDELNTTVLFPNPTHGKFFIILPESEAKCLVEVRDISGKMIYNEMVSDFSKGIDLSSFANGQYIILVITGTKEQLFKISKNN